MDLTTSNERISALWSGDIVNQLHQYIAIPALSPMFDPDWKQSGHLADAVALVVDWLIAQPVEGMTVRVQELDGRTPLIVAEIAPFGPDSGAVTGTTVLYGHIDKQPEMTGWRAGLGPWKPVMEGSRLYGRGGADDGYAAFCQPGRRGRRPGRRRKPRPTVGSDRSVGGVGQPRSARPCRRPGRPGR